MIPARRHRRSYADHYEHPFEAALDRLSTGTRHDPPTRTTTDVDVRAAIEPFLSAALQRLDSVAADIRAHGAMDRVTVAIVSVRRARLTAIDEFRRAFASLAASLDHGSRR